VKRGKGIWEIAEINLEALKILRLNLKLKTASCVLRIDLVLLNDGDASRVFGVKFQGEDFEEAK
jgi:hypothetical protein